MMHHGWKISGISFNRKGLFFNNFDAKLTADVL